MIKIPRIVIAGTNSGCGKTTVTAGIMSALVNRGLQVQAFKVGPDYIDPMFHTFVTGRYSRNLDSWMLKEDVLSHLFVKNSQDADISVVEGVMGFYDGFGGHSTIGSTSHVSIIINAPVILVVNGEGTSLSLAALVKGFKEFDKDVEIRGIIINNIKSQGGYQLLKEIVEETTGIPVVGYLLKNDSFSLTSRHLGLIPSGEIEGLKDRMEVLSKEIEKTIDLEQLINIANESVEFENKSLDFFYSQLDYGEQKPRIAVAWDKAFNFYYQDNLDLLENLGAKLEFFSPLKDSKLPDNIDGLYFGGGYPEVYAKDLEENALMRQEIKKAIEHGIPAYAECGGLMYLSESLQDKEGNTFNMAGCIPGESKMTSSLQRFGYIEVELKGNNVLTEKPNKVRAHEFHYSTTLVKNEINTCY
ncbi:MAG: hypothetical protein K0R31_789, partial [Clostridiales bacterium]|nr:hypothetical protein [Clostridiales bacterium]